MLAVCFALLVIVPTGGAEVPATQPSTIDDDVAPFINELTQVVARIDFDKVDLKATQEWFTKIERRLKPAATQSTASKEETDELAKESKWVADFRKAGGKQLYWLWSLRREGQDFFVVVPVAKDANADALKKLVSTTDAAPEIGSITFSAPPAGSPAGTLPKSEPDFTAAPPELIHGSIVWGANGTYEALKRSKPLDRPDVWAAMAAVQPAGFTLVAAWSPEQKKLLEEIGWGWSTPEVQSHLKETRWLALGLVLPPNPQLHLTIQMNDAAACQRFHDLFLRMPNDVEPEQRPMMRALIPSQQGSRLVHTISGEKFDAFAVEVGRAFGMAQDANSTTQPAIQDRR